jgi:hypothetical protein
MSNPAPITLEQLFRFYRGLPHQLAAISELEDDIRLSGYPVAMRRDRPWFKTWSTDGKQDAGNLFDHLRPLLDLIAAGEGNYTSINRGKAGDTPGGHPGLDRLTIAEVMALQKGGVFAVGRYQFIPDTLAMAVKAAGFKSTDVFSAENQDWLAIALLLGGKRPKLRDYLQGKDVPLEAAQLDLAKEWASIPQANGRGFYDGDSAGNKATAKVAKVQAALIAARGAIGGRPIPQLRLPAQQPPAKPKPAGKLPPHLTLTRTRDRDGRGLELLQLSLVVDSIPLGSLLVVSGAASAQQFRTGAASRAKSLEPLPEGRYKLGPVEWANGAGNYEASWGPGLGAVWVAITYDAPGTTSRSALGFHLDENAKTAPGSAGCVVFRSLADLKTFVGWLGQHKGVRELFCDWGLGTCPKVKAS